MKNLGGDISKQLLRALFFGQQRHGVYVHTIEILMRLIETPPTVTPGKSDVCFNAFQFLFARQDGYTLGKCRDRNLGYPYLVIDPGLYLPAFNRRR